MYLNVRMHVRKDYLIDEVVIDVLFGWLAR